MKVLTDYIDDTRFIAGAIRTVHVPRVVAELGIDDFMRVESRDGLPEGWWLIEVAEADGTRAIDAGWVVMP